MAHISQLTASMENCTASREHIRLSNLLIEGSREAIESSRAMLTRTDRQVSRSRETLAQYDVRFVDHGGNVFGAIVVVRDADGEAVKEAHGRDVPSIGAGFDIWCGSRLVYQHRR